MRWLPYPIRVLVQGGIRFATHEQFVVAGYMAYSFMLSMLPFLIFATALTGFLVGSEGSAAVLEEMFDVMPDHVARTLEPVVIEVTSRPRSGVLTIAALGTIWAASNGVEAVRIGLNRAYEYDKDRHLVLNRLVSLVVVVVGFFTFTLLAVLLIFAPLGFQLLETHAGVTVPRAAEVLRFMFGTGLLFGFIWVLHRVLPARRMRGYRIWPGILVSAGVWIAMATGLSGYLTSVQDYSVTYGTLAGVIVTLLFLYLTGIALMYGAEVNAAANEGRMRPGVDNDPEADDRAEAARAAE